ncbi:RICIN domain-containing protein [Amycolatopsis sp. NBC_01488]|uniref:RICIN domain-containing protein n=1 Tax=Amycolatopsis sp. NBC_01488 TaxID=2903563 RepID=UPI002E2D0B1A|nr:RICIN domain-containing protein [Amycolatopsis sp. NBC_01488]
MVWAAFGGGHDPGRRDGCTCSGRQTWTSGEVWKFFTQLDSPTPPSGVPVQAGVNYTLVAEHSGLAMDVWEASIADGARVSQRTATGGANQRFRVQRA